VSVVLVNRSSVDKVLCRVDDLGGTVRATYEGAVPLYTPLAASLAADIEADLQDIIPAPAYR